MSIGKTCGIFASPDKTTSLNVEDSFMVNNRCVVPHLCGINTTTKMVYKYSRHQVKMRKIPFLTKLKIDMVQMRISLGGLQILLDNKFLKTERILQQTFTT